MQTRKTTRGSSRTPSGTETQETVLVVDDDVRVIELLQITLSGRGYQVKTAFDGEGALEHIEKDQPDLVVLDVRLPRKNGFQVLEHIRGRTDLSKLPVILISGNPSNETRIQGLRLGADDFLSKPFSPRELIMKIRRILDRAQDTKILHRRATALEAEVSRQRDELVHSHAEMHTNLLRIGGVLQRVEQIGERQNLTAMLEGFLQAIMTDIGIEMVCIFTRDLPAKRYRPQVWRGTAESAILNLTMETEGFLAQVLNLEARTMSIDEFADYPRAAEEFLKLSSAGFTHLSPVKLGGETVALIAGGDKPGGVSLEPIDLHLLSVLARSAAASIKTAEMFEGVRRTFVDTTAQLIDTIEGRYENLAGHSKRVHDLALQLAQALGVPQRDRQTVAYAARLHDLGALEEYESLFADGAQLDDEARSALRQRSADAVKRLLEHAHMPGVATAVLHLNEYWDGSGLPDGLAGESIPEASRIVSLANAYDALIHDRPHRPAYEPDEAIHLIRERVGHQFDPALARHLERIL